MSPIPKSWRAQLRGGARARFRGAIELDRAYVPLEVTATLEIEDEDAISLHVTVPLSETAESDAAAALTPRERAVVSLIGLGKETDEIARMLFIAPATVRTHVRNAMSKVDAHTRAQLVARVFAGDGYLRAVSDEPAEDDSRRDG
jgi:DNA-binding NarL/FixJ family response regulator